MTLSFGIFRCVRKTHIQDEKGLETYRLVFEDEKENKLSMTALKEDLDNFNIGQFLPWELVQKQSTL